MRLPLMPLLTVLPRLSLMILMACALNAAEVVKPAADPLPRPTQTPAATVDPATVRKAEAAADAYQQQANTRPDPLAETALADIEVLLLEVHAFLDAKNPLKAGECYLGAIEKRKTIDTVQRPLLGKRLRKADLDLLVLSRELLGQPAFDLGDPPAPAIETPAK